MLCNKHIWKYLSQLQRMWSIYINKKFEKFWLSAGQYHFLIILYKNDWICQEEVSKLLHIDKWTTAKALLKLEKFWYIERKADKKDKRFLKIFLTQKAYDIKDELIEILFNRTKEISKWFTENEIENIINSLEKMSQNACNYLSTLKNN
jgi:DNA-binding MarR family transcriptional regulator